MPDELPPFPAAHDPEFAEKRRAWMRAYAKLKNNTPEGRAANKARKDRYRAKPGVRDHERAWAREYNRTRRTPEQRRASAFKHHHGIERDEADRLSAAQGNRCATCGEPPTGRGHCGRLHVDHDHETGRIRGLLCNRCNQALGLVHDRPETLRAMIEYLSS